MYPVQIVVRSAPPAAVELVERAFHEAGLETSLHVFSTDAGINAAVAVEIAEGQAAGAHAKQAWIVPAGFAELQTVHTRRASAARVTAGIAPRENGQERLLIVLADDVVLEGAIPSVVPLAALEDGRFGPERLRAAFV